MRLTDLYMAGWMDGKIRHSINGWRADGRGIGLPRMVIWRVFLNSSDLYPTALLVWSLPLVLFPSFLLFFYYPQDNFSSLDFNIKFSVGFVMIFFCPPYIPLDCGRARKGRPDRAVSTFLGTVPT